MTRRLVAAASLLCCSVVGLSVAMTDAVGAQTGPTAAVTFYKDVAPLLQKNCETCHRPGQIAPMAFQTFESTRPWAACDQYRRAFEEDAAWFAEAGSGHILNDRSLKPAEIRHVGQMGGCRRARWQPEGCATTNRVARRRLADHAGSRRRWSHLRCAGEGHRRMDLVCHAGKLKRGHVGHVR
jgi:hypothetical protein